VIALADSPLAAETIRGRKAMLWNHLSPEQATGRGITSRTSVSGSEVGEHPPRHALHYPLVVEQEVIGLLSLSRVRDEPFTEADLLGLQEFGTLNALIVRNAHLLAAAIDISRAKSKFVNLAAHELRTPVSVLKGYLSMIADGVFEVSDEVRDGPIQVALDKVVELDDLVEQLVLVARLEAGKFVASASDFAARDAVRESVDRVRKKLRPEAASFEVSSSEGGAMVRADRDSVRWVLAQLLRNAVAFSSPPAQIKIAVRATSPVEIAVEDRGYGIPPQHHARVFEPFFRLDETGQAMVSGAGLGLSIGRELAERSGGSLELERSVPGEGSVFVLRLPAVQANEGRAIAVVGDGGALEPRQGTG
jgi:signal transduction histidine kinase